VLRVLGRTGWALLRAAAQQDSAPALQAWSRGLLRDLHVETHLAAPLPEGAPLWIANHLSWLDPMVLMALRPMATLAKAEVARYPIIGAASRRIGLRFVDRSDPLSRAAALVRFAQDLRRGERLLLFPEGTTTRGEALAPLHAGGLRAAHRLGVSILPLRLSSPDAHYPWTGDESLLPHLKRLAETERTRVLVEPGPVHHPRDFPDETAWVEALRGHLGRPATLSRGAA